MKENSFLKGDIIYLRTPDIEKDVENGSWHEWFNDPEITKYLVHGVYPNTRELQKDFVISQIKKPGSLLFSIVSNETDKMIGVTSLKAIDHLNRNAEIGLVMGFENKPGAALEAMILLTQHAFDRLNLQKVYAGQHHGLWKWINTLETIGYKIEGYQKNMGYRNGAPYDVVRTAITADDYYKLKKERNGSLMSSFEQLYRSKRKENLCDAVKDFFDNLYKDGNQLQNK